MRYTCLTKCDNYPSAVFYQRERAQHDAFQQRIGKSNNARPEQKVADRKESQKKKSVCSECLLTITLTVLECLRLLENVAHFLAS